MGRIRKTAIDNLCLIPVPKWVILALARIGPYAGGMGLPQRKPMDWSDCPIVEVNPRTLSGVPIVRGTRVQADAIVENYESGSPIEEISENFQIPENTIIELLLYAKRHGR
jgi:uncharacterized protein (DUF433 family)